MAEAAACPAAPAAASRLTGGLLSLSACHGIAHGWRSQVPARPQPTGLGRAIYELVRQPGSLPGAGDLRDRRVRTVARLLS